MWKRIAFDEYRPPQTPLLTEALPPELSDDEAVPCPRTRRRMRRTSKSVPTWRLESEPTDVPASFMRELIAAEEADS